jgi:hypothetical protein
MKTKIFTLLVLGMMFLSIPQCQAKNILTDLEPYPNIGILGTSLSGWDNDVDMLTTDGIHYSLLNYPLTVGSVKFRQDDSWGINWGGNTFPTGIALQNDPNNIPIPTSGNYDITFNIKTGEYSFTCVSNCPAAIGIIGTAVPPNNDWDTDVNMGTNDGKNYFLKRYTFTDGEAKFRQDDGWNLSWGNNTFPTGTALPGGANIPVTAGTYNVTFNIETGDYSFTVPSIGILGSALSGWDVDVDMQSTDNGITYTLLNYSFNDGEVKFRQDDSWSINWGNNTFPSGTGYQDGPDIPVLAGTYNVTFNILTGEYNFTATTCPIAGIQCPDNLYVGNSPGICGANVYYPPVVAAANCGGEGITIKQTTGLASGSLFPVGTTTNTFELTNAAGNTATCSFDVVVYDYEPPVITGIADQLAPLWPPNHKMVPVHLDYSTTDNCGGNITSRLYVYSNEPDNGLGDGDVSPDWKIVDNHNILLRAERSGTGSGRVYSIYIISHDNSYYYTSKLVTVAVPHDKGKIKSITGKANTKSKSAIIGGPVENVPFSTNVWPNPSTNSFKLEVQSSSNENIMLSVFDINGHLISNLDASSKQTTQFGEDLNAGIYLVFVRQGNHFNTIKVVKQ